MSKTVSREELERAGQIVSAPRLRRNLAERPFGLHPALIAATIGAYVAFLAIMAATFRTGELILPFAICFTYVAMAFGTPALWGRIQPPAAGRYLSWAEFRDEGLDIETGRIGSGGAIAQVMVLPLLIVGWSLAIAVIVATL